MTKAPTLLTDLKFTATSPGESSLEFNMTHNKVDFYETGHRTDRTQSALVRALHYTV